MIVFCLLGNTVQQFFNCLCKVVQRSWQMKIYCLPITSRFFLRLVNVLSENKPVKPSCLLRNSLRKLVAKFQSRKIASVPLWPKHFQTTWIVAMGHKQGIGVQDCQILTVWGLWKEPVKDHKISECLLSTCPYLSSLWSHYCHPVHWSSTLVSPLWQIGHAICRVRRIWPCST